MIRFNIFGISVKFQIYQIAYLILMFVGIYLLVSAGKIKKNAKISAFIIPSETLAACRDKEGFAAEIWKSILLLGIVSFGLGIYGVTEFFFPDLFIFQWGYEAFGIAVFFLSVGWVSKQTKNCIEKFCKQK